MFEHWFEIRILSIINIHRSEKNMEEGAGVPILDWFYPVASTQMRMALLLVGHSAESDEKRTIAL